jgi:hypothetical protein
VSQFKANEISSPLQLQGQALARLFLQATTAIGSLGGIAVTSVQSCEPLVLVEYGKGRETKLAEIFQLPKHTNSVDPHQTGGIHLGYVRLVNRGRAIGIWFLDTTDADLSAVRQLRLGLFRLHQEQEVLRRILQLVIEGAIPFKPHTASGDRLESYLNRATRVIFQQNRHGVDQDAIRGITAVYELIASKEERDLLMQQLDQARGQVRKKVVRFVQQTSREAQSVYVVIDNSLQIGELTMANQATSTTISFGTNNTFHGDVVAAANIEKSFNKAAEAKDSNLQEALKTLTIEVGKLTQQLPDGAQQQTVSRRLNQLVEEAASPQPDKSVLEVTGKGLLEAAKSVAEMVPLVTAAVKGVLSLFGVALL